MGGMRPVRTIAQVAILVMMVTVLSSFEAVACRIGRQYGPPEDLVKDPGRIALAELIAIDSLEQGVHYRFRLIEALRGEIASGFSIDGDRWAKMLHDEGVKLPTDDDFGGHHDAVSGQFIGGRTSGMTDCEIHPVFQKGGRYLIFLDALRHPWGSERIIRDDDRWLLEVRRMVGRD
jgi:hypothetical protein